MKKHAWMLAVVMAFMLSGCATQTYKFKSGEAEIAHLDSYDAFFLLGVGQTVTHDAARLCGGADNIRAIEHSVSFGDVLLNFLLSPIYTPRTAKIYCG